MRWTPGGRSDDVEDRRGESPAGGGFGGGGMRLGIGGFLLLAVLSLIFKKDFFALVSGGPTASVEPAPASRDSAAAIVAEGRAADPVRLVRPRRRPEDVGADPPGATTNGEARPLLGRDPLGLRLRERGERPVLLSGRPEGLHRPRLLRRAAAALRRTRRIRAGVRRRARARPPRPEPARDRRRDAPRAGGRAPDLANALSVRLELQADCFAGVWGHSTSERGILESGDVEAGLNAAAAIGDDRLQRSAGRGVHPESFTHGSSAQRVRWFRTGLESGSIDACDTFRARDL